MLHLACHISNAIQRPNEAASLVFRLWIINEEIMARKRLTNLCSLLGCVKRFHTLRMQLLTCTSPSVNNASFLRETWIDSIFLQVTARKFPLPSSFANKTLRHFRLNINKDITLFKCREMLCLPTKMSEKDWNGFRQFRFKSRTAFQSLHLLGRHICLSWNWYLLSDKV